MLYGSTGKVVDMSGFHDSVGLIKLLQVGTDTTAIDLENKKGC
jgi:hypothetical protein